MGKVVDEAGGDQVAFLERRSNAATRRSTGAGAFTSSGIAELLPAARSGA
jgi:hypothetical protein